MPGIRRALVGGALLGLAIDHAGLPWRWNMVPLAVLCVVFGALALREKLPPVSASTDAPVTPGEMIKATMQNPTIFIWVVLMMFTASTEFAPGQWLDVALTQIVGMRGMLVLAYVSGLMFVMRHFAGPLVKRLGNIGLLIFSSFFAAVGLFALGGADSPATVLAAATVWGFGVAYFWPTMLATVAERYPRSGTMVFGLMGSAGAACTYVVLPYLGAIYDKRQAGGGRRRRQSGGQCARRPTARHPDRGRGGLVPHRGPDPALPGGDLRRHRGGRSDAKKHASDFKHVSL